MDSYDQLKNAIIDIARQTSGLLTPDNDSPGLPTGVFEEWRKTCASIRQQLDEETVRVAVVGAIKSGKSTFINALFREDYLKRGAGVITSIVTRVRSGPALRASLHFKSWDAVNRDIGQALVLFPSFEAGDAASGFDIRRSHDRSRLRSALDELGAEQWFTRSTRNPKVVLLESYLEGYEEVQEILSADESTRHFDGDRFLEHQRFVANDDLAVYLRDIELSIDSGPLDSGIEIADCQGSDSSNPLHLAMIQDYLLLTHMIIYVISSRTGLRQADIRFLNMIRNMGIMDNALFVVNCDISEHESLENLTRVVADITRELSMIKPGPEIFTLSALYSLFKSRARSLPPRERGRLAHWEAESGMVEFLEREFRRFEAFLSGKLDRERLSLLLRNHLERLGLIASGADHWAAVNRDILSRDAGGARDVIDRIARHQEKMNDIKSGMRAALDGALEKLKRELRSDTDHFFDPRYGDILQKIGTFITHYQTSLPEDDSRLEAAGFSNNLYLVYQDFKQALDGFMAETVNPEVIRFVRQTEKKISARLIALADPYLAIILEAQEEYRRALGGLGIHASPAARHDIPPPDLETIKAGIALSMPPAADSMNYSARVRTEAVFRLGFYSLVKLVKKVFKKPIRSPREEQALALKDGLRRIKRETEEAVTFHFKNYRENLKFAYFFKLAEAVSSHLFHALGDRFQSYSADLVQMVSAINEKQIDKGQTLGALEKMGETALALNASVERLKQAVEAGIAAAASPGGASLPPPGQPGEGGGGRSPNSDSINSKRGGA
jgi:GTPase SAR1 family protein